jgi:hypothetical protein
MDDANGLKATTRVTAPVASNTLSVNVFTTPGKAMAGERPRPFGERLGFDPITSTLIFASTTRCWWTQSGRWLDDCCCRSQEAWRARLPSAIQDTRRYLEDFDRV